MSEKTNIATLDYLNEYDPAIGNAMTDELKRQRRYLELIASENIVSPAVMAAMGSLLTNKYAEGYPGKRMIPEHGNAITEILLDIRNRILHLRLIVLDSGKIQNIVQQLSLIHISGQMCWKPT